MYYAIIAKHTDVQGQLTVIADVPFQNLVIQHPGIKLQDLIKKRAARMGNKHPKTIMGREQLYQT